MIAIFRIRFDTNTNLSSVWPDTLFNNYMHIAIPYSLANFWWESAWGNYDLNYDLFPEIVITDPNPGRPGPLPRNVLIDGTVQNIEDTLAPRWEDYDVIFLWYAQRTDMFGGASKTVNLSDGNTKNMLVTVVDSDSRFDGVCQELGHSFGLAHEINVDGAEYASPYSVMSAMNEDVEFERPADARLPDGTIMSNTDTGNFIGKFAQHIVGPSLTSAQLYTNASFKNTPHVLTLSADFLLTRNKVKIFALDYARERSQTIQLPVLIIIPSNNPNFSAFAIELRRGGGIYDHGIGTVNGPKAGLTIYTFDANDRVVYLGLLPTSSANGLSRYYCKEGDFTIELTGVGPNTEYVEFLAFKNWKRFQLAPPHMATQNAGITAVSRIPNSMEIFWIGGDGSIWDAFWYEGMAGWEQFQLAPPGSASVTGGVTAVSRIPNSMEVFWIGTDGSVWDAFWYEGMSGWERFQLAPPQFAAPTGGITAISRIPNSIEIFWIGGDGSVWDAFWYEGMAGWQRFQLAPPNFAAQSGGITAVSRIPNSIEIFWIGGDGSVWDAFWYEGSDGWNRFQLASPGMASQKGGITVVSRIPNSIEIFWIGGDGSIWDAFWYEGMTGWNSFQLAPPDMASQTGGITAVSRISNGIQIFWTGGDGSVWDALWNEGMAGWSRFQLASPGMAAQSGGVTAISRISNSIETFWIGGDGSIWDSFWYE